MQTIELNDEIQRLLRNGEKIPAIKLLRDHFPKSGLKQCKDMVDSIYSNMNISRWYLDGFTVDNVKVDWDTRTMVVTYDNGQVRTYTK